MKIQIFLFISVLYMIPAISQADSIKHKQDLSRKIKIQKDLGWTFMITGGLMAGAGTVSYVLYEYETGRDFEKNFAIIMFSGAAASFFTGVQFFNAASKNKKRLQNISWQFNLIPSMDKTGTTPRHIPSLSIRFSPGSKQDS